MCRGVDGAVAEEVENSSVDTDREGSFLGSEMKDFGDLREDSHDDLKDNESNILDELSEAEKLFRGVFFDAKDSVTDNGTVETESDMVETEPVKDADTIEPEPANGDMAEEQVTIHEDNKEYIDHGRYVEDYSDRVALDDAVPKVMETADFVEHGRYIEDYKNTEEDSSGVVVTDTVPRVTETIDFVDHGRYVEDYVKEEKIEVKEEPVEVENTKIENENIDDLFNPEELETEISALEAENNEPEVDKENSGIFSFTNEVNQKEKDSDLLDDFWLQVQSDISLKSENTESELENILSEIKEPVVEKVKEPEEHVPEDIRDFIREHKGSEIGYVAKFYSKKVIEKNIAMGRIYKRKGKLFI